MDTNRSLYRCVTCYFACSLFSEAIDHLIIKHPGLEMSLQKLVSNTSTTKLWQTKRFVNIIPDSVKSQGGFILADNQTERITVHTYSESDFQLDLFNKSDIADSRSPHAKKLKVATSTPIKAGFRQSEESYSFEHSNDLKRFENVENFTDDQLNIFLDTASVEKTIEDSIADEMSNMSFVDEHESHAKQEPFNKNIAKQEKSDHLTFVPEALSSDEENEDNLSSELRGLSLIDDDDDRALLDELSHLLPSVLDSLSNSNQKETFMKFARMVASGQFPMNNIAYLLFMDVVDWFSSDSTTKMRYSEDTKKFWRVGLKLFRGKFLRFMSGMKNKGQLPGETACSGVYKPLESKVNFAVPNRSILDHMDHPIDASSPKVMTDMIDMINQNDPKQTNSYKVCVDGKKINSGTHGQKLGDVNLWGFESSPSLEERVSLYNKDIEVIHDLQELLVVLQIQELQFLEECSDNQRERLSSHLKQVISILGTRLRDLRTGSVGQKLALQKLLKQVTGDWRTSKYGYAISAIKTKLHEMETCIVDSLSSLDSLGEHCSFISGTERHYTLSNRVDLESQGNYVCLQGLQEVSVEEIENVLQLLPVIQQRSEAWFSIRKLASITGSTFHKAIGMESLKKQQYHFDMVYNNKKQPEFDSETQKRLQHGQINEINAVATIVSKVLPVFFPDMIFYEEGCYALEMKTGGYTIVSPDGSLRQSTGKGNVIGIEIKCPFPDKTFTTPIHYKLPTYYVPQVLCEMAVLKADQLLFVSYSEQSTSVLKVEFDSELMNRLLNLASELYPRKNASYPRKLHPDVKQLRKELKTFVENRVSKVCEVRSVKAKPCGHKYAQHLDYHRSHSGMEHSHASKTELSEFETLVHKCTECVKNAYNLCRLKATEVLVFLTSNMDRIHKPEVPHAMPIAYAMKGYSMKTEVMRCMIEQVLNECYTRGLYVPVISFDGQWYNIAIRDRNGAPLTLLQLQKDVYSEAKQESKQALLARINQSNIVQASDIHTLKDEIKLDYLLDSNNKFKAPINVGGVLHKTVFAPSLSIVNLIKREHATTKQKAVDRQKENEVAGMGTDVGNRKQSDCILSVLPDSVINSLDEAMLSEIRRIESEIAPNCSSIQFPSEEILQDLPQLFTETEVHSESENSVIPEEMNEDTVDIEMTIVDNDIDSSNVDNRVRIERFSEEEYGDMLNSLNKSQYSERWETCDIKEFSSKFISVECIKKAFNKKEITIILRSVVGKLKEKKVVFGLSWPKYKVAELLFKIANEELVDCAIKSAKRKTSVKSLRFLSRQVVASLSKTVLNAVYAVHIFPSRLEAWRNLNPFVNGMNISGYTINWYCKPEIIPERYQHLFALLDPHHLFTNSRIKCCNSGIPERGINKEAWLKVAKEGNAGLNRALVEDLVDRQSDSFARATFSESVERAMIEDGFVNEANFCRLIRDWYESEDEPGISANNRCKARLDLRDWLLKGVQFNCFPPPGMHIKGIPMVMFEGMLTNIERRMQLFSFVKKGTYNVRSLGSLEAENLFGEFQDLDPKGTGVIRPDDVPCAISTACELLSYRMDETKPFFMHTSKAKCYPMHTLLQCREAENELLYCNPHVVASIEPRDHLFDSESRRTKQSVKRKLGGAISTYNAPARHNKPVRKHHECNEEKVMPDKRANLNL